MTDPSTQRNTSTCDFLVIGGGIVGLASAVELARTGAKVTVVDASAAPAGEASGAAAGILSLLYPWEYPPALQALAESSTRAYPGWCAAITDATGADTGWSPTGLVSFDAADAPPECARLATGEVRDRLPMVTAPSRHAIWLDAATVEPRLLLPALAAYAVCIGVELRWRAPVERIVVEAARARGVELAGGERVTAGAIVLAAGAWSAPLLHRAGARIEVRPVRGQIIELDGPPGFLPHTVVWNRRYLVPRPDGRIVVGSTSEEAGYDRSVTDEAARTLRDAAAEIVPASRTFPVRAHWSGLRPGSPAGTPTIGPMPGIGDLWLNIGHFRNGITLAPASAVLLAALATGAPAPVPADAFAL